MEVNTGAFTALTEQVATLKAEMAGLRHMLTGSGTAAAVNLIEMGKALRDAELAEEAARRRPRRSRPGYLHVLGGGTS
jgi:hypothetical protein